MRSRVVGVVTLLLLCPITAELLQAYLSDLGGPFGTAFAVLFFAPLYGGAALLVREVSERTGRGWTGRLLMAAAFGVAMTAIIDVSLFTPFRDDIEGWRRIYTAAEVGGIGWSAVLTWVGGHVVMSVGVPLVVAETFARRPGPWLGRLGTALVVVGFLAIAVFIHQDQVGQFDVRTSPTTYAVSGAIILALIAAALSPLGRPLPARPGRVPAPGWCLLVGAVAMAIWDITPPSWLGVVITLVLFLVVGVVVSRWARSPEWTGRHLAALAFGALAVRSLLGFTVWIVLVVAIGWALERRTRADR